MDGLHHALEHRVEELARLLGIAIREQLHRALEVSEEDGDLLALALQSGLGGEDALSRVLGGVGLRRAEPRTGGYPCRCPERSAATPAELLAGLVREPAGRTRECQRGAALRAEAAPLAVVMLAPGTFHAVTL